MLKFEFIEMQHQDLVTKNSPVLIGLLLVFEEVLKAYPLTTEIDSSKNVEDCYKKMEEYAKKHAENNSFCFTPDNTVSFVKSYLGLKDEAKSVFVNLEDFV